LEKGGCPASIERFATIARLKQNAKISNPRDTHLAAVDLQISLAI
jgi:hypothetical protein